MASFMEREGIGYCEQIASKNGWYFREQLVNDIGIDAHIERCDPSGKSIRLIALQIKSGKSYFRTKKNNCYVFYGIDERQYNYWINNTLPCVLVLYNPETMLCIWQKLTIDTIKKSDSGKYSVEVPENQIFLNDKSNKMLLDFSNLPAYVLNYNFLLSQKEFMEVIKRGGTVKLHSVEWVNKSSGKGNTELIIVENGQETTYKYPYWFPYTPYSLVFPKLFPWATFSIDEDIYENYDTNMWHEIDWQYDKEDGEWIHAGYYSSLDEYRKTLELIRGIPDSSGEVANYDLILGLNELGKSFLEVNKYLSDNQPYINTKPEEK